MTRVKVCGVRTREDAELCYQEGVYAIGFVHAPGRKRSLEPEKIKELISTLPPGVSSTLITLENSVEDVIANAKIVGPDTVQTYSLGPEDIQKVKDQGFGVIRAVTVDSVTGQPALDSRELAHISKAADLVFFEPSRGGRSGGLGLKFDSLDKLSGLISTCPRFGIAGGLNPDNVGSVLELDPLMVDVSSGVESPDGRKDRMLVRQFVGRCRT